MHNVDLVHYPYPFLSVLFPSLWFYRLTVLGISACLVVLAKVSARSWLGWDRAKSREHGITAD
jgi:hypothetical protein